LETRIAEQDTELAKLEGKGGPAKPSPSTPSGVVPIYTQPNTPKRRQKPGARNGRQGVRREPPVKIDERQTHRLTCCPPRAPRGTRVMFDGYRILRYRAPLR